MRELFLRICGRQIILQCPDRKIDSLLRSVFGGLAVASKRPSADAVTYRIERRPLGDLVVIDSSRSSISLPNDDRLVWYLDKEITVALQCWRPDLYFIHAAVLARQGYAAVISAPAGTGKSTLALALLEREFDYCSDELAPVDVPAARVHLYTRALCLKSSPPVPHALPPGTFRTGSRYLVPANAIRRSPFKEPVSLGAIFILRRSRLKGAGVCRRMSAASATAHLMSNALNGAAHGAHGLDSAERLAKTIPCFELTSADLEAACSAVEDVLLRGVSTREAVALAGALESSASNVPTR